MNPLTRRASARARSAWAVATGAAVWALAAGPAHPQGPTTGPPSPLDRYAVDVWTTDHGLPQNSVNAIAQTPDGYLWLGTSGGLARFDGLTFTRVERRDSLGTHLDRVVALAVGPDGALWIATENGLLRYQHDRFTVWREADGLPGPVVGGVHVDVDGTVWALSRNRLVRFDGGAFTVVGPPGPYWPIVRDATGVLWFGPAPRGGRMGTDTVPLPAGARRFLYQDGQDRWFGMLDGGLLKLGATEYRWRGERIGVTAVAMARDRAGDYWIGSVAGVKLFQPEGPGRLVWPVPLPEVGERYDVRTLFVDGEGTLWVGTNGYGLVRVARQRIRVYAERDGLSKTQMTAVMEDRSGRMILATNCGGLHELPSGSQTIRPFPWPGGGRGPDCPMSLAQSADGALWIGEYGPLRRIHDGVATEIRFPDAAPLGLVHSLYEGKDGTMWAGRLRAGLAAVRPDGSIRTYRRPDGLADETVLFVTEDAQGVIWVGTPGGLGRLEDERFTWFTAADGLPTDHVRAVYQDAEGTHWIGTYGGGMARLKDGRFTPIEERDGLADNVVSSILEDDDGYFWMTGNRGIQRARRAELAAFADGARARVHAVLYDRTDGLLSVETNGGFQPAAWRAGDGTLWFPTVRGVAMVDPTGAAFRGPAPRAALEVVLVDQAPAPSRGEIRMPAGRRNLEVHYTGLSLIAPEHIVFRYRLQGFQHEWQMVGTRRQAFYPRLPPGRYRFEVQAANRDGVWGQAAAIPVRALPWVWETAWFRLLVALGALSAAAWAVRHRFAVLHAEQRRQRVFARRFIEGQETERKRIAAELHDSIGQGLLVAKNRAALALRSRDLTGEARQHLDEIASVMTETLETAREISHNLRPHELDRLGLAVAVRTAAEQASATGMRVAAQVDGVVGVLSAEAQINVYRIVQEALNNVMKHARATNARVALTREGDGGVRLVIADNGVGFDVRERGAGFGLSGIAQRVALMGGSYEVNSAPGSGTTIVVRIPPSAAGGAS